MKELHNESLGKSKKSRKRTTRETWKTQPPSSTWKKEEGKNAFILVSTGEIFVCGP